ncbi:MAG: hypothetical protein R2834_10915 [Rhodothermales bacterium]
MDTGVWIAAAKWVLAAVLIALISGLLARNRDRERPTSRAHVLSHPTGTLVVGLAGLVFFGGIAILSNVYANSTTTLFTTATFIGFALLSLPLILGYLVEKYEMSDQGIRYRKMTGTSGLVAWNDVVEIRFAPVMKWFRIETRAGKVLRISLMLQGLPGFAKRALRLVPADALDEEIREILALTVAGYAPGPWD